MGSSSDHGTLRQLPRHYHVARGLNSVLRLAPASCRSLVIPFFRIGSESGESRAGGKFRFLRIYGHLCDTHGGLHGCLRVSRNTTAYLSG
jgi:hypothetical protein